MGSAASGMHRSTNETYEDEGSSALNNLSTGFMTQRMSKDEYIARLEAELQSVRGHTEKGFYFNKEFGLQSRGR